MARQTIQASAPAADAVERSTIDSVRCGRRPRRSDGREALWPGRLDKSVGDDLQEELRDLLCLAVVGDHVRWVLNGERRYGIRAVRLVDAGLTMAGMGRPGRTAANNAGCPSRWSGALTGKGCSNELGPRRMAPTQRGQRLMGDRVNKLAGWALDRRSRTADPETLQLLSVPSSGLETQAAALQTFTSG